MPEPPFWIRESSWLARVAAWKLGVPSVAITLGRTIHLYRASRHDLLADRCWLRHELKHVEQFRQYGFLRFIGLYLAESARVGYHQNRFEREARAAESDPAYDPVILNPPAVGSAIPAGQTHNA